MAAKLVVCPKCGRADAVRKVSSIVTEGTVFTDTSALGLTTSSGELVGLMGSSISRSALVEQLSPPRKPARPSGYGFVGLSFAGRVTLALVTFVMVSGIVACSFPLLYQSYRANPLLIFIPFTAVVLFTVLLLCWIVLSLLRDVRSTHLDRIDYLLRCQQWERATERWQHLYYCFRDDGVFLPTGSASSTKSK